MPQPLLSVNHLDVDFEVQGGVAPVIDDVSFELHAGETLTLVGESGCGKSMMALAIMGLLPDNMTASGEVQFGGNLLCLPENELCQSVVECEKNYLG